MKKILPILLFILMFCGAYAQSPACDGNRYKNYVFTAIDSTTGIQYGHNFTMNGISQDLLMDVFQPNGDTVAKRPLIMFVHGGAFYLGSREEGVGYCSVFAYKGFVTATIDYRLIDVSLISADSITIAEGMIQAVSDAKAAIRFFVNDAATSNIYKIDTNYIFIAGLSAGGITASQVAYLNTTDDIPTYISDLISANGGFTGNSSDNTSHTTPIKGVINYSGAMWRKEWMNAGEPALFSAHDNLDSIVPCNHGLSDAFSFPVYLDGTCIMATEANSKGIYNQVFINNSSGHGAYFQSYPLIDTVLNKTTDFLYDLICGNALSVNENEIGETPLYLYPNPANDVLTISLQKNKQTRLQIYNAMGMLIKEISITRSFEISIADLPNGFYFIQIIPRGFASHGRFA